ncbi:MULTISPECIES: aminoimidazole riboside kinase [Vibrio]|uniref:aminoimidazole riboside kinase n=1 Tax=Vibrio TaxID=662 RepID=UPI0001B94E86|nr:MULTISPECIES: aminoimidazole riboside kinase [Vibrio]EEX31453.1 fructokinase [Vibrio coralliilyticus ATCC BAA-450]MCM5506874.1 aminoimidazole riboside kinase [Vibrio sp. SCSIO 43169]MDE3896652.1 aminoimidazole riboside kinase [Vibrio sp. CC007]NRF13961.1 aminoimidazole riboside kinase [Vibrio coralliilyticus]QFT36786.1 2-dehydro-3-deoxygluconokinase [Vibrio sp. THAF64]
MMKNRVWVTGDAVVDLIPDSESSYLKCPGGAPANVAVAIARLGGDAAFIGRVGQDPLGRFMQQTLKQEQVDTQMMILDEAQRTSTVIVDLDDSGERSFTFMVKPSADQFLETSDLPTFTQGQWLHVCSIALANEPSRSSTLEAMRQIKAAGGYVSFDPNLREEVWANPEELKPIVREAIALADVVKFSDDELLFLTGSDTLEQGVEALKPFKNTLVLITQGAKGALVLFEKTQQLIASQAVSPVDTTGAGDAFVGGLLAKLSQYNDWQQLEVIKSAVKWANGCGALATTQKGAMTALPSYQALEEYILR